jgi:hypothetical protein
MRFVFHKMLLATTLLCVVGCLAQANVVEQHKRKCANGNTETWTLFQDDCDNGVYSLWHDCDGKDHWGAPKPDWNIMPGSSGISVIYPPDFWTMLGQADLTVPGGDMVWVVNGQTEEQVWFRNPYDATEEQHIINAWTCPQLN